MKKNRSLRAALRKAAHASMLAAGAALVTMPGLLADEPVAAPADSEKKPEPKKEEKADGKSESNSDTKSESKSDSGTKEYRNWFDTSVGGVIVGGDKAAYQRRTGLPG